MIKAVYETLSPKEQAMWDLAFNFVEEITKIRYELNRLANSMEDEVEGLKRS